MRCPICNQELGEVTPAHAKKHGMTRMEMYNLYPELKKNSFQTVPKNLHKIKPVYKECRRLI